MAKQAYIDRSYFRSVNLALIDKLNAIMSSYLKRGMKMTVRQLYYQAVTKNIIPNTMKQYKNLVNLLSQARLAGLIDWDALEDRGRGFIRRQHWRDGKHLMGAVADNFHRDMWESQDKRVFVLIEKEALVGVLESLCHEYDVPLLACKGYPSLSVLRDFCLYDILPALNEDQRVVILHLGDHDPSGIDMTRDLREKADLFCHRDDSEVNRLALNMPQIERLKPAPNPAKMTDSRFKAYARRFGRKSWELDAIPPDDLQSIVRRSIVGHIDWEKWDRTERQIEATKKRIKKHAKKFKG